MGLLPVAADVAQDGDHFDAYGKNGKERRGPFVVQQQTLDFLWKKGKERNGVFSFLAGKIFMRFVVVVVVVWRQVMDVFSTHALSSFFALGLWHDETFNKGWWRQTEKERYDRKRNKQKWDFSACFFFQIKDENSLNSLSLSGLCNAWVVKMFFFSCLIIIVDKTVWENSRNFLYFQLQSHQRTRERLSVIFFTCQMSPSSPPHPFKNQFASSSLSSLIITRCFRLYRRRPFISASS